MGSFITILQIINIIASFYIVYCFLFPRRPIVISVEGIIGAGKTTFIEEVLVPYLKKKNFNTVLVKEPIDKWGEILKRFGEDTKRWAYHFQTKAFHDRVFECKTQWDLHEYSADVYVCERSIISDKIFMRNLYINETIDNMEMDHYLEWWSLWETVNPLSPDMFIYIKPGVEESMLRMRKRDRDGESGITSKYQADLEKEHDKMLLKGNGRVRVSKDKHVPVYVLQTDRDYLSKGEVQNKILSDIKNIVDSV